MLTRYALVLCLLGSACATDDYDGARLGGRSLEKELCPTGCDDDVDRALGSETFVNAGGGAFVSSGPPEIAFQPACSVLPTNGACAVACDPGRLAALVPNCQTIACYLHDGRTLLARSCGYDGRDNLTAN